MKTIKLTDDQFNALFEFVDQKVEFIVDKSIEYQDSEQLQLTFSTAWSPPEGIVEKLREKYPDLSFSCFYDEPGCEVAGYY